MITDEDWQWRITTAYTWLCKVGKRQINGDVAVRGTQAYIMQRLGCSRKIAISVIAVLKSMKLLQESNGRHKIVLGQTINPQAVMLGVEELRKQQKK